jgi:adenylate cyclase
VTRTVPIRRSLLTSVSLMILGLCLAILAVTLYTGRQIVEGASTRLIGQSLNQADAEVQVFFEPLEPSLRLARRWVESGLIDIEDDRQLNRFFVPLLETYPQISSVNYGDAEGRGWMLLRQPDGWLNRRVDPPAHGPRVFYRRWSGDGRDTREWWVDDPGPEDRYDPRTRSWYETAVTGAARLEPDARRPAKVYWTEPYVFFTTREPGITAAAHVRTRSGRRIVMALDVLLNDITEATQGIEVSTHGFVAVLDEDRRLLGLPRHERFQDPAARFDALLQRPADLGIEVFDDAIAARQARGGESLPTETIFPFRSGGQAHWAGARVRMVPPERRFLLVVVVPERDLLGPVNRLRLGVLAATVLALAAAVISAFQLARRYGAPLSELARNSARIRRLDLRSGQPVRSRIREVAELANAQDGMRTALDAFSRYVPTDVVRELLELGEAARIGGERRDLTVLFTDIQGFTSIAERKSPEELTRHLAAYFEEMLAIIDETGTVDKLVGDGIMAFWGAPYPDPHHARHAVEAALECSDRLEQLNRRWQREGEPPLPTRFGLATGAALVGNVGSPRRLSYTAVGDVVNLASRLEGLNRLYGTNILAAEPIPELAGDEFVWREVDRVRVVGRREAVAIHELLGPKGHVDPERLAFAEAYGRALDHYRARAWVEALAVIDGLPEARRSDPSVERLRAACVGVQTSPPPPDWEPVTTLERK